MTKIHIFQLLAHDQISHISETSTLPKFTYLSN